MKPDAVVPDCRGAAALSDFYIRLRSFLYRYITGTTEKSAEGLIFLPGTQREERTNFYRNPHLIHPFSTKFDFQQKGD